MPGATFYVSYRDIVETGTFHADGWGVFSNYANPPLPGDVVTIYQEDADGRRSPDLVVTAVRTMPTVYEAAQEWVSVGVHSTIVEDYSAYSIGVTVGDFTTVKSMSDSNPVVIRYDRVPMGTPVYTHLIHPDGIHGETIVTPVYAAVSNAEFAITPSRIYATSENDRLITRDVNMGSGDGVIKLEPAATYNHPDFELYQGAVWSMEPTPAASMNQYGEITIPRGVTGTFNVTVTLPDGRTASAPIEARDEYININNYVPISITSFSIKSLTYPSVYDVKYGGGMNLDTYNHEYGVFDEIGLNFDITPENADRAFEWALGGIYQDVVLIDTRMPNALLYVQGDYEYDPATSPPKEPIVGTLTGRALNGTASHTVEISFANGDIIIGDTTEPLPVLGYTPYE